MKQVVRYKCDFCKKAYANKYRTRDHEKRCFHNPANKSCSTCNELKEILDSGRLGWCFKMNCEIFRKGYPIKHCVGWEAKESEDEEG